MKRIFTALLVVCILCMSLIPASAADPINAALNANVTLTFGLDTAYKNYAPAKAFDGNVAYFDSQFADFKMNVGQAAINDGTASRYNIMGETDKPDSLYLAGFQAELAQAVTIDSFRYWDCGGDDRKYNIDGFDIWVSETGAADSWVKVVSTTKMHTGGKYTVDNSTGKEIATIGGAFAPIKAKFIAFGVTEPRGQEPKYAHYFRITELALYEAAAVETTTAAPVTTAPAATPATADISPILPAAAAIMLTIVVHAKKRG